MIRALLLSLLLAFPAPALAADSLPRGWADTGLRRLVGQLSDWIVERTTYAPLDLEPPIVFLTAGEIALMVRGPENYAPGYDNLRGTVADGVIFLLQDFRIGEHDDVLLHELVHVHQMEAGQIYGPLTSCGMEAEAYRLQADYIEETGVGIKMDPMFLLLITEGCEE